MSRINRSFNTPLGMMSIVIYKILDKIKVEAMIIDKSHPEGMFHCFEFYIDLKDLHKLLADD
jgi:hypothetical protein